MIIITLQCTGNRPATKNYPTLYVNKGFPGGSGRKESSSNVGDLGSIPGLGRFPQEGNGYPFQYSGMENCIDGEAWQATVHGVTKSWTQQRATFTFTFTPCSAGTAEKAMATHSSTLAWKIP